MMQSQEKIVQLCNQYTNLNSKEIDVIIKAAANLEEYAESANAVVFIDCICKNPHEAVVVAAAYTKHFTYPINACGMIIRDIDEPGVFRTLRYNVESKGFRAPFYFKKNSGMLIQNVKPIRYEGQVLGGLVYEWEFTGKVPDEKAYYEVDYKQYPYLKNLHMLAECVSDAIIVLDQRQKVVYRNNSAASIYKEFGYLHDILDKQYQDICMHGGLLVNESLENAHHYEEFTVCGNYYYVNQYCYLDEEYFYILVFRNITQQRHNEENMVLRSVAIREAHHRIKNNLQNVYGLLDLQRRRFADESEAALQDAMNRIMSISTTYDVMLKKEYDYVSLIDIVEQLKINFLNTMKDSAAQINIVVRGHQFDVDPDISTNISLVINELLQNSFKHAFKGCSNGEIEIVIDEHPLYSRIIYTDNGIGFDTSKLDNNPKSSLGMQIIRNIIKHKLKGKLDIQSGAGGTVISFDFRTQKPK